MGKADNKDVKVDMENGDGEVRTIENHDRLELMKQLFPFVVITMVTYFTKAATPMVMQTVMMPMHLLSCNLAKVYVWKQEATGALKRPWKDRVTTFMDRVQKSSDKAQKEKAWKEAKDAKKAQKN